MSLNLATIRQPDLAPVLKLAKKCLVSLAAAKKLRHFEERSELFSEAYRMK